MKKKSLIKGLGIAVLAGAIVLGGTLAYLSSVTETRTNTFASSGNVEGKIVEENWDETGEDEASNYKPGNVIAKDPTVQLEADSEPAYVGMQLDFIGSDGVKMAYGTAATGTTQATSATGFQAYATHDGINTGWSLIGRNAEGSELYFYTPILTAGTAAGTIFDNITVNAGITTVSTTANQTYYTKTTVYNSDGTIASQSFTETASPTETTITYYDQDGNAVGADNLPTFEIAAKGYAIQSEDMLIDNAKAQILALANAGKDTGDDDYFDAI